MGRATSQESFMTCFKGEEQGKRSESPSYFLLFFSNSLNLNYSKCQCALFGGSKSWSPSSSHLPHTSAIRTELVHVVMTKAPRKKGSMRGPVPRLGSDSQDGKTDSNSWQGEAHQKRAQMQRQGKNCGHVSNQYSTGTVQGVMCRRQLMKSQRVGWRSAC